LYDVVTSLCHLFSVATIVSRRHHTLTIVEPRVPPPGYFTGPIKWFWVTVQPGCDHKKEALRRYCPYQASHPFELDLTIAPCSPSG
jgi:hypothetical protein